MSYAINDGPDEFIYIGSGNGMTPKGSLGYAKVMLAPGDNQITLKATDTAGGVATYNVPNSPIFDFGDTPDNSSAPLGECSNGEGVQFVMDRIVVIAKDGIPETQVASAASSISATIIAQVNPINMYWLQLGSQRTEAQLNAICAQILAAFPNVLSSASLDTVSSMNEPQATPATNDPWWGSNQWGLDAMQVPEAWEAYKGKLRDTKVGVVDTPFRNSHEDLQIPAKNISNRNKYDKDHGTHVMGTIGATHGNGKGIAGVINTSRASLYGYDAFSANGAYDSDILAGLSWAVANGAKAVNFSIGGYDYYDASVDKRYSDAMRSLLAKGYDFVVVHAAGNSQCDAIRNSMFAHVTDPSLRQRIITVGSIDSSFEMAYSTSYGPLVDVVAPGVGIYSTTSNTDSSYGSKSGTSMAAPHVTGLAGLLWSADPGLSGPAVKQVIVQSARESGAAVYDSRPTTPANERLTYYCANAKAALEKALGPVSVPVTSVTLNKATSALNVGDIETLTATIAPSNATNKKVTWTSSNPSVATVTSSDLTATVNAVAAGTATITVKTEDANKTATCTVTVTKVDTTVAVTNVTLNKATSSLTVGGAESLTAAIAPS
ncbi:MAG: S8 family serine peptidase, partial [Holophagales bacterium]|nr:S8 family serine peptidase [Holophagales bacterium]